jgi:hypothetical protein
MAQPPTHAWAAVVGLAWADISHAVCRQAAGADTRDSSVWAHPPEAIRAWAGTRRHRCGGQPMAVCREWTTGLLVSALRAQDLWGRFPGHALTVATDRDACTPSRAQDAPSEAALRRERLVTHRDPRQQLRPPCATRRTLDPRVACRRRLVEDQVRLTTRLTSALHTDVPHVWPWFADTDTPLVCDVLTPWPPLTAGQRARRAPLERCVRQPHGHTRRIAPRLEAIHTAKPLTTDEGVVTPHVCLVRALVAQRRATWQASEACAHALAPLAPPPPDVARVPALPGAGPVFAPRLRVAFGAPRAREASASDLPQEAGLAPGTERRGHTGWVHWRQQGPTCLRQTCVAWAGDSTRQACWARAD